MKHLFKFLAFITVAVATVATTISCNKVDSNTWDDYAEWRELNTTFFDEQQFGVDADGNPLYATQVAQWNPGGRILIHYFNDRKLTEQNLMPMLTSTVDVKYRGTLYNGVPFDSSYIRTTPADSIYRTKVSSTIEGWWAALLNMHVGDSVRVVIPYSMGYGGTASGIIPPFSTLVFDIKLVDIADYETP